MCLPRPYALNILNLSYLYCHISSLGSCLSFQVIKLGCDVSAFSYASLLELNMFQIYYKGGIPVESPSRH